MYDFLSHIIQYVGHDLLTLAFHAEGPGAFGAPPGVAGPQGDAGGAGLIGGVSNLMAAAMATAGAYGQARILDNFQEPLTHLAGLCYLSSLIAALTLSAIYGQYRNALFFLIGPPVFYFAITVRTNVDGTELRIGNRRIANSIPDQIRFLKEYANSAQYNGQAKVSTLFLGYDALVTSVVQGLVGEILDTKNQEDVLLRSRERVFSWVIHGMPNEGAFVRLLAVGNNGRCSHVNSLAVDMHNEQIFRFFGVPFYTARGWRLFAEYQTLREERFELDEESWWLLKNSPKIQNQWEDRSVNCRQIWQWSTDYARALAAEILKPDKFIQLFGHDAPVDRTLDWDRIRTEVIQTLAGGPSTPQINAPQDVLAAYMIRHTVANNPLDRLTADVYSRAPFQPDRAANILGRLGETESYGAYMKIVYVAGAIPYAQGLLLYILSLAFPFFAVLLVMPGRASSFFLWFSLWAWVKSWDVGYALVDVARKVLWQFMGHGTNAFKQTIDWNNPGTVYSLITQNDPVVTHNTYLQLMAFLTASVPLFTAHLCMGAVNMMDFLKLTVDQNANKFAKQRASGVKRALITSPAERARDEAMSRAGLEAANRTREHYLATGQMPPDIAAAMSQASGFGSQQRAWAGTTGTGNIDRGGVANPDRGMPRPQGSDPNTRQFGDMSLQRAMAVGYQVGMNNYNFTAEGRAMTEWLGVAAGRTSTHSYGMGERYLNAYTGHLLHQTHYGGDVGRTHNNAGASGRVPDFNPTPSVGGRSTTVEGD